MLPISFFFFNDTATTEIYTLSLHDALPICCLVHRDREEHGQGIDEYGLDEVGDVHGGRSEVHTSELQSQSNLVCRLLLEKKKNVVRGIDDDTACQDRATSDSSAPPLHVAVV